MRCCKECFASSYIKEIIVSNSNDRGICCYCSTEDEILYEPRELFLHFKNLIELYVPNFSDQIHSSKIETQIVNDFTDRIFNVDKLNSFKIRKLLIGIIEDEKDSYKEIFENSVYLECLNDPSSKVKAEELKSLWNEFSKEIKSENRFHLNRTIDLGKLEKLLKRFEKAYKKGKIFYRARISDKKGYKPEEMKNPPISKARAGRANPDGISYLYLSGDLETTIYETRAYLYDYVTIGEFRLNEDINVINLQETQFYDPMLLADQEVLDDFLIHLPFVSHLENELSKPIRRSDHKLDYIPTQYLSEFIKSLGKDGIEYKSSLNSKGSNLTIFNSEIFECIRSYVKEIHEISYSHRDI